MIDDYLDGDPDAELLVRQWFAASNAAEGLRAECEVLLRVIEIAEDAWRRARSQLAGLEALQDSLGASIGRGCGARLCAAPFEAVQLSPHKIALPPEHRAISA